MPAAPKDKDEKVTPEDDGAGGHGFRVGQVLLAKWMGQTERTCVVIDRSTLRFLPPRVAGD
jgi:hypothetical protein